MKVYTVFSADIAHFLTQVPEGHPCRRLHGHRIKITLTVDGPLEPCRGWVQDTHEIERAFAPIYAQLDHHLLNDIPGLENPTSELLARWIWHQAKPVLPFLAAVQVAETESSGVRYFGE